MEGVELNPLIRLLDDSVDDLEEALQPLLSTNLIETANKLPLLDKAKLYVLIAYAIESILFSFLRLHGEQAREHPVFQELKRVKQYFAKIKQVEFPDDEDTSKMRLDREAANRFIKHALASNKQKKQDSKKV